ncbi:MAG: PKD domain-containing protein [Bacteroidetes bacterium]|nr:PKD domain-containing protein [Bacteroidota bacterium]
MQTRVLTLVLLLIIGRACLAQDSIPPEIRVEERGDSVHFSARLRPLRQIAGAPASFYTYFWELGDGRFSFDKEPSYAYRDTGEYQVRLYATNNYDDGKAPPTRPRPVKVRKKAAGSDAWASHFFRGDGGVEIKINRSPRPGEDFVTVIGYRNRGTDTLSGSLVLFYNERQFGQEGFALSEQRTYNKENEASLNTLLAQLEQPVKSGGRQPLWAAAGGEGSSPEVAETGFAGEASSMLRQLEDNYSKHTVLHFPAVRSGEEKFVFLDMNTLPTMLQDTNATVSFTAMMVPDNKAIAPEVFTMDMQVVASHDPNRMMLKSRRINYRFMGKKKELVYRVQFQNTGKGPAKKISIGIAIPKQLNTESVTVKSMSPVCVWCDSAAYSRQSCIDTIRRSDSIYFVFNNIYLPGMLQEGVTDKDSTMGYVEYAIRFKKKPKKIPFNTQAAIIFDKNEPVMTNKATARFIKGLSPGIMVGYSALPSNGGYSAKGPLQFGYVLAPYKPYRPYFQAEIFVGLLQQDDFESEVVKDQRDTVINRLPYLINGRQTRTTTKRNSFEITPLHYRYNINDWIGVGLGAMAQINISEQMTVEQKVYFIAQQLPLNVMTASTTQKSSVKYLGDWNAAPFVDLQLGRVRTGPVLGIRYIRLLKGDITDRFFLYAGFKL